MKKRIEAQQRVDNTFWDAQNLYYRFYFSTNNEDVRGIFLRQDVRTPHRRQTDVSHGWPSNWCHWADFLGPFSYHLHQNWAVFSHSSCLSSGSFSPRGLEKASWNTRTCDSLLSAAEWQSPFGGRKKENSFMDSVCECFQTSVNGSKHLYSNKTTFPVSCCLVNITRDDCHRRLLWNCTTRRQEMEKFTSKHSTKMTLPEVERGPNKVPSQLLTDGRLSLSMRLSPDSSKFPCE